MELGGFRNWSHHWICPALWVNRASWSAYQSFTLWQNQLWIIVSKGPDFGPEEASNSTNLFFSSSFQDHIIQAIHCISTMLILPQPLDSGSTKKKHSPFLRGGIWQGGTRKSGNPRVTAICVVESWQKRVKWPLSLVFMPTLRFLDWKTLASEKG